MTTRKRPESKSQAWELAERDRAVRDVLIRIARRLANEKN